MGSVSSREDEGRNGQRRNRLDFFGRRRLRLQSWKNGEKRGSLGYEEAVKTGCRGGWFGFVSMVSGQEREMMESAGREDQMAKDVPWLVSAFVCWEQGKGRGASIFQRERLACVGAAKMVVGAKNPQSSSSGLGALVLSFQKRLCKASSTGNRGLIGGSRKRKSKWRGLLVFFV